MTLNRILDAIADYEQSNSRMDAHYDEYRDIGMRSINAHISEWDDIEEADYES